MPKVTPEYREARRQEIARAALRCLGRRGVAHTSIADVVAESGLSAGAIYSHFTSKAELASYLARTLLHLRIERIVEAAEDGQVRTPVEVMTDALSFVGTDVRPEILVQLWAEATVDAELGATVQHEVAGLRQAFATAVLPWAVTRTRGRRRAEELAERTALSMVSLCQGYIVGAALLGLKRTPAEYLADASSVFAVGGS